MRSVGQIVSHPVSRLSRCRGSVAGEVAAALLAVGSQALAQSAAAVVVDCPELGAAQVDEFGARARLLIHSTPTPPRPPRVQLHCTQAGTRLYVDGSEAGPIDVRQGIVEGALDALEAALETRVDAAEGHEKANGAELTPPRHPTVPRAPRPEPDGSPATADGRAADERRSRRARPVAIGGIGLAVQLEPLPAPLDLGIGPRLDVALGAGQVAAVASEGLVLGVGAEADAQLIDAQVGLAWGAPFAWGANWGALVSVGLEWLTLPAREQTVRTTTVALALRSGVDVEPAKLWLGLDGSFRVSPQRSERPAPIAMKPFSLGLSIGGFWLAE